MTTRVVLREEDKPALERVMAVTGVDSYSAAIALLVTRYADSLCQWWLSDAHEVPCPYVNPEQSNLTLPTRCNPLPETADIPQN